MRGVNAPLAYVAIGGILLLFSFGYAAMSHHVTSAAGLAAFVESGLGRRAGFAAAFVAMLSYSVFVMGLYGGFGFTASYVLDSLFGLSIDPFVCAGIAWALVAVLGYRAVELNVRVLGVLLVLEIIVLLVFDVVSTAKGGADGISMAAFNPSTVELGSGLGIALLFAAVAFLGFEATAIYGEEAKAPRKSIATATYAAVVLIAGFYTLTMWALGNAYGNDKVVEAAASQPCRLRPRHHSRLPWRLRARRSERPSRDQLLRGCSGAAQHAFALCDGARACPSDPERLGSGAPELALPACRQPRWFRRVRSRGPAVRAQRHRPVCHVRLADRRRHPGHLRPPGVASVAVIAFFRRQQHTSGAWSTMIAPALAFVGIVTVIVLGLQNWDLLSGATSGVAQQLPWMIPIAALAGALVVTVRSDVSSSRPKRRTIRTARSSTVCPPRPQEV